METLPDEVLAVRMAAGDRVAWRVLHARVQNEMLRHAVSLRRDADEARDLVQETLLRAWDYRTRYSPIYPYRAWLHTILQRLASTHYRRQQAWSRATRRLDVEGSDAPWARSEDEDALEYVIRTERREQVSDVMAQMRRDDQQLLREWATGATGAEIAKRVGRSPSAVRGRIKRAKERFAEAYEQTYPEHVP